MLKHMSTFPSLVIFLHFLIGCAENVVSRIVTVEIITDQMTVRDIIHPLAQTRALLGDAKVDTQPDRLRLPLKETPQQQASLVALVAAPHKSESPQYQLDKSKTTVISRSSKTLSRSAGTNYANLQAAITRVSAEGGGTVRLLPNTTYTGALTVPSNVTLYCPDRSSILTIPDFANSDVVTVTGSNTAIQNCTIDGNSANQSGTSRGISIGSDITKFSVDNIELRNTYSSGALLSGVTDAISNIAILNSYIHDTGLCGLDLRGIRGLTVKGNLIKAFALRTTTSDAICMSQGGGKVGSTDVVITKNLVLNTVSSYFGMESAAPSYFDVVNGCDISDNVWDAGGLNASGISGYFFNCTFDGNTHKNGTGSHRSGYEIVGTGNTISNNTILNGTIVYTGGNNGGVSGFATITGNYIRNESVIGVGDAAGVMVGGGSGAITDLSITGNQIYLTNAHPQSAIFLGVYGTAQQIDRINVTANKLYGATGGNGIRLLGLPGSGSIDVENNTVTNFANGWMDDASAGHYSDVSVLNNDLRGNGTGINHNFTGGSWLAWGNITAVGYNTAN
jgi:hypothetical protein